MHALLSPSGAHRWLICTPSVRLEETFKDEVSKFALEGTIAHELAEFKLGKRSKKPDNNEFYNKEMEEYTDIYINLVKSTVNKYQDPMVLIEEKLDYSNYVEGGFGTGDAIIAADRELNVIDLKYGKGIFVLAEDNPQMKLYALGALNLFEGVEKIIMTICQPRLNNIKSYEMSADELIKWAEEVVKPRAKLAYKGEGDYVPGQHCKFCKAKSTCRARAKQNINQVKYDFTNPDLLEDHEIEDILKYAKELQEWAKDVQEYALNLAVKEDKKWEGFKLLEGRGKRQYASEDLVANKLIESGHFNIYKKQQLISITELEKLIGKKNLKEILGDLIEKRPGKQKLIKNLEE